MSKLVKEKCIETLSVVSDYCWPDCNNLDVHDSKMSPRLAACCCMVFIVRSSTNVKFSSCGASCNRNRRPCR